MQNTEFDKTAMANWFNSRTQADGVAIAVRSVLRTVHYCVDSKKSALPSKFSDQFMLNCHRSLLSAYVTTIDNRTQFLDAAELAYSWQDTGYFFVEELGTGEIDYHLHELRFAIALGDCAADLSNASRAYPRINFAWQLSLRLKAFPESEFLFEALKLDSELLDENDLPKIFTNPIWPKGAPATWEKKKREYERKLSAECWHFWTKLVSRLQSGLQIDIQVLKQVVLILDEDWNQGPEHIAELIEEIELTFRTAVAPRLVRDETAGVFREEQGLIENTQPQDFVKRRVGMALDVCLSAGPANGLSPESYESLVIKTVVDDDSVDGSLLATALFDACMSLQKNIGEVYPEVTSLINLKNALYVSVEELCELDPVIRQRIERLVQLGEPAPITQDDRNDVTKVVPLIEDQLDKNARQKLASDAKEIASVDVPSRTVRARFTNWITTVALWLDRANKGEKRVDWLVRFVGRLAKWWAKSED